MSWVSLTASLGSSRTVGCEGGGRGGKSGVFTGLGQDEEKQDEENAISCPSKLCSLSLPH